MRASRSKQRFLLALSLGILLGITSAAAAQGLGNGGVNVLTWHNDTYRTGENLNESILTYNTISKNTFGQLCSQQLDGQVYSQPLAVTNVTIGGTNYPYVVYVVTENDTLYAINGTPQNGNNTCQVIASLPFLTTSGLPTNGQHAVDCRYIGGGATCPTIKPTIGILGTPVININNGVGAIYLVTETQDTPEGQQPNNWYHYLYSVGLQSMQATSWVQICASGCGSYTSSSLFSKTHIQRPGLLLANCGSGCVDGILNNPKYVYVAFSMMDGAGWPYPNGTIFGYDAANLNGTEFYFQTSIADGNTSSYGGGSGRAVQVWPLGPPIQPGKTGFTPPRATEHSP